MYFLLSSLLFINTIKNQIEALANVILAGIFLMLLRKNNSKLPFQTLAVSGTAQVSAKGFTMLAIASGISFPVVTLAKSGKMLPVMAGSLLLGGAKYSLKQYLSVFAIIIGTMLVSMAGGKKKGSDSIEGLIYILLSLTCDGIVAGMQDKFKKQCKEKGIKAGTFELMFWTNFFMAIVSFIISIVITKEFFDAYKYCADNSKIMSKILNFAICSAVGQSFIFYTIDNFDPLVCTTVTTTRKIFSVLLSIFINGVTLPLQSWLGIVIASSGILVEAFDKKHDDKKKDSTKKE